MSLTAQLLFATGIGHCGIGWLVPELREPMMRTLQDMSIGGPVKDLAEMNERYAREASFWFQFGGIMMIISALQVRTYYIETKKEMPSWYGWALTIMSVVGVTIMPESGFWLVLFQGARIVWINQSQAKY